MAQTRFVAGVTEIRRCQQMNTPDCGQRIALAAVTPEDDVAEFLGVSQPVSNDIFFVPDQSDHRLCSLDLNTTLLDLKHPHFLLASPCFALGA